MGEIRIVGPGKTRGYPYLVCKKRIVAPDKTRGYPYPVCKNEFSSTAKNRANSGSKVRKSFSNI